MHPIYHIYPSTAIVRSLFLSFLICFWICWSPGPDPFQANDSTRFLSHHLEALRTGKLMPRTAGSRRYMLREVFVPISREYIYIYIIFDSYNIYIYIPYLIVIYIYISYLMVIIYIYIIYIPYLIVITLTYIHIYAHTQTDKQTDTQTHSRTHARTHNIITHE